VASNYYDTKSVRCVPLFSYAIALQEQRLNLRQQTGRVEMAGHLLSSLHCMANYDVSTQLSPWYARLPMRGSLTLKSELSDRRGSVEVNVM
jgi:hypothetical protein